MPCPVPAARSTVACLSAETSASLPRSEASNNFAASGAKRVPVASVTASASATSDEAAAKSPLLAVTIASELDLPPAYGAQAIVVPQRIAGRRRHPAPAEALVSGSAVARERARRLQQRRGRGTASFGDQQREAVQEYVYRARISAGSRERRHGAADPH